MLGSILTAAVPLVATLAVALYVYRRIQQCGNMLSQAVCEPDIAEQLDSGYSSGTLRENPPNSTRNRKRPYPYLNRINSAEKSSKNESGSPIDMYAQEEIDKECAVCFEKLNCVQLYPCKHSRICMNCVNKIISDGDRLCPFCRQYIEAYRN